MTATPETSVAIVPAVVDPGQSPFGERFAARTVALKLAPLVALQSGQILSLDILDESAVHLRLESHA